MTNRLDVRLDVEHRRRLEELAQEKGAAISDVVRSLIDGAYEDILRSCQGRRDIRTSGGAKVYHSGIDVQRKCPAATGVARSR